MFNIMESYYEITDPWWCMLCGFRFVQEHGHDVPRHSGLTSIVKGACRWHRSQNE